MFALLFGTRSATATSALAANLLGAIVGGLPEYAAMAGGTKGAYVFAAACWVAAVLTGARGRVPGAMLARVPRSFR